MKKFAWKFGILATFSIVSLSMANASSVTTKVKYTCDSKIKLTISYVANGKSDTAQFRFKSKKYKLKSVMSGSGAKYSDDKITWWTKGNQGMLIDDFHSKKMGKDIFLAQNCIEVTAK